MSHILHRHSHSVLPMAARGDGAYIIDNKGGKYLDACGGAAVSNLGHNHPVVIEAIKQQLDQIPFVHSGFFANEPAESLASYLTSRAPAGLDSAYFVSGGSEAVESALKLARQYFLEIGEPSRQQFIARRQSYHGNTLGALGVGGNQWRKKPFDPLMVNSHLISPCYAYRDQRADETSYEYGQRVANELEEKLLELGPETVAGFIAEPVVGATAGAVPAVDGYFKRIREICDQYGVLLILDEVMCGSGRTGTLFACEQEGVVPDMLTMAKGLGAGYQPIGATLIHERITRAIASGSGFFQHGHTYIGHPTVCAASLATLKVMEHDNLLDRVNHLNKRLVDALHHTFDSHPNVGDIRGRGLFLGIELVVDRATKAPLDPSLGTHKKIKAQAMQNGLMCYPGGGTIDGIHGDHILLAPPFILQDDQIDELVEKLSMSLRAVLN